QVNITKAFFTDPQFPITKGYYYGRDYAALNDYTLSAKSIYPAGFAFDNIRYQPIAYFMPMAPRSVTNEKTAAASNRCWMLTIDTAPNKRHSRKEFCPLHRDLPNAIIAMSRMYTLCRTQPLGVSNTLPFTLRAPRLKRFGAL
ncbi:MAG: hypothetical protein ACYTE1_11605, partial [Planctomycetota bacterium]